jgi:hypothetical protein
MLLATRLSAKALGTKSARTKIQQPIRTMVSDTNTSRSFSMLHRRIGRLWKISMVMLAFRHDGDDPPSRQSAATKKTNAEPRQNQTIATPSLIRWSIQEVRHIAIGLARNRIQHARMVILA